MALQMFQAGECSGTSLALIGLGAHVSWEPWEVHWRRRWRFGDKRIDLSIHARVLNYSSLGVWFLQFPELGITMESSRLGNASEITYSSNDKYLDVRIHNQDRQYR